MKTKKLRNRKCSAVLAAGAGAAMCLGSGEFAGNADAAVVTGLFKDSNAGGTATGTEWKDAPNFTAQAFNNANATWLASLGGGKIYIGGGGGGTSKQAKGVVGGTYVQVNGGGGGAHALLDPGITVNSGMNWLTSVFMTTGTFFSGSTEKYYGVRFTTNSGTNWFYGWWHMRYIAASKVQVRAWGYQNTADASILTLADSVTTSKLDLTDGQVKLHWTNSNEDGVARYEVQAKDASGEWQAVDSDAPGEGAYAAKVDGDGAYRLVVERVDGETEEVEF